MERHKKNRNSPLANILPRCGWYNEIRFSFFGRNMLQQDRQIRKKDAPSQGCTALLTLVQNYKNHFENVNVGLFCVIENRKRPILQSCAKKYIKYSF